MRQGQGEVANKLSHERQFLARTKCDLCRGIKKKSRTAAGHPDLEMVGKRERQRVIGQANTWTTHYICKTCRSKWRFQSRRDDEGLGWSVDG